MRPPSFYLFSLFATVVTLGGATAVVEEYNVLRLLAGNGTAGYADGDAITRTMFGRPYTIIADFQGVVYVADGHNRAVRKFDPSTNEVTTIAGGNGHGISGDHGMATSAKLSWPWGLSFGSNESILYVGMERNVRKIDLLTGVITTFAGGNSYGYDGDGGLAIDAKFQSPRYLFFRNDNLYVGDENADVVRKINSSNIVVTVAGNGTKGFYGDDGPATLAMISKPNAVAVDTHENVYIADANNDRIRKVDNFTGFITTFAGSLHSFKYSLLSSRSIAFNDAIAFYRNRRGWVLWRWRAGKPSKIQVDNYAVIGQRK